MANRHILISGAGIAGATLAYWLVRSGFRVTIVELADSTRSSGAPVDVKADSLRIVAEMGILDQLRAAATMPSRTMIVDGNGAAIAQLATQNSVTAGSSVAEIELSRAELASALLGTVADRVEIIFGDSITAVRQHRTGVDVSFDSGTERSFDLLIGADGIHSVTRRLLFGEESRLMTHLGLYFGGAPVPGLPHPPAEVQHYNLPGRSVTIHPADGIPLAAFIFRSPRLPDFDHRDLEQHRRLILQHYAHDQWRTPELLDYVRSAPDIYFDAISRVDLPTWWSGRVALVGDAASAVSLLGDGSSRAIIGGYTLAGQLADTDDHQLAFRRYQDQHRKRVAAGWQVRAAAALLVPRTGIGISVRNRVLAINSLRDRGLRAVRPA